MTIQNVNVTGFFDNTDAMYVNQAEIYNDVLLDVITQDSGVQGLSSTDLGPVKKKGDQKVMISIPPSGDLGRDRVNGSLVVMAIVNSFDEVSAQLANVTNYRSLLLEQVNSKQIAWARPNGKGPALGFVLKNKAGKAVGLIAEPTTVSNRFFITLDADLPDAAEAGGTWEITAYPYVSPGMFDALTQVFLKGYGLTQGTNYLQNVGEWFMNQRATLQYPYDGSTALYEAHCETETLGLANMTGTKDGALMPDYYTTVMSPLPPPVSTLKTSIILAGQTNSYAYVNVNCSESHHGGYWKSGSEYTTGAWSKTPSYASSEITIVLKNTTGSQINQLDVNGQTQKLGELKVDFPPISTSK